MSDLRIGVAQRSPLPCDDPAGALRAFREDVAATLRKHPDIQMLVFPEMHLNGTEHLPEADRPATLKSAAVTLNSAFVNALGSIASEHGIWLCPGSLGELAEASEKHPQGDFFNTQLLFDPAGTLRASYRKMFPWRPFEPHTPGTEFVVAELDGTGVAGMSICYDAWFPEHSRQTAWLGADVILNIVKTTSPDREQELVLARANAIVNQVTVVSVNCAGPVGRGRSIVVDAEGFVMAEAGIGEETLVVTIDPDHTAEVRGRGTMFTNRMWNQLQPGDAEIPLPMYNGTISPARWAPRRTQASDITETE
ncbi:carbon-nitrogen hydrolase family protein [Leucobacter coleopterorum]|uniref:Carbon-nitrogen hydrolase family protein n=1 Tax=Leucobacter coleopterorum TaxID=2714933 RepID=A0ABX6JWA5_9MICO|nr:carbon-nitrogen hydrolase family protein [Leucobacter coleopterorum]QIM17858.1 carbon-nitrogen hydrolase family protein [Leucobacter coleopterorum]